MSDAWIDHGYVVGLDLGKLADYTAISVLRQRERHELIDEQDRQRVFEAVIAGTPAPVGFTRDWSTVARRVPRLGEAKGKATHFELVHLDRVPLGTSYPGIVDHVRELLTRRELRGQARLVVDATGVGVPIVDLLRDAGVQPVPITITGGGTPSRDPRGGGYHVPKRDLVDLLAVLLQTSRLAVASSLRFAQALADELLAFEAKITAAGHDTYGAREGAHDDLVLSVAIAAWVGMRSTPSRWSDFPAVRY